MKKTIRSLALFAVLESVASLAAQTVTVDPAQMTLGYMNWSPAPGDAAGYGGSGAQPWVLSDLPAVFSESTLTIAPNTNTYAPGNNYWVNADGSGANIMDANVYAETTGVYVNTTLTFTFNVVSNTLVTPYTSMAFIKDFAPDYSSSTASTLALTPGVHSISLATSANAGDHVQYGFETDGPDAKPSTAAALGSVVVSSMTQTSSPAVTGSVLANPGFESDAMGETTTLPGWTTYGLNAYGETGASIAHGGVNYFKVYQAGGSPVNYSGIYQDYISGPGATYAADGWACTVSSDAVAGQNAAWIEVTFRDANATVLALYRSALITTNALRSGAFLVNTWVDLPVTNQYDPNTYVITNTPARLVTPEGTYFVRYQIVFQGDANNSGGSVYFDDLNLAPAGGAPYGNWNIVWSDEFNGTNINQNLWTYDLANGGSNPGWGNNEQEYYTGRTNNAYAADGTLHIVALQETTNSSAGTFYYTSARMKSQGLFSVKYGRLEWRAQLPAGTGTWPALWLLGTNITTVPWPGCGEIDVMENNGNNPGMVQGSLHSGSDETAIYNFLNGGSVTAFHTYTLDWSTNALLFYVDGHLYETQTSWGSSTANAYPFPFNQPFFLIMNLAIGGNYVGNPSTGIINAGTSFPAQMQVDYVRLYRQTAPLQLAITRTNSGVLLSWPGNIVCHLQTQTNLPGTNWVDAASPTNLLQITPSAGAAFYRLKSP